MTTPDTAKRLIRICRQPSAIVCVALLSLGLCSCASARKSAALDPFRETPVPVKTAEADSPKQQTPPGAQTARADNSRDVKLFEAPFRNPIEKASNVAQHGHPSVERAVEFSAAESRGQVMNAAYQDSGAPGGNAPKTLADLYPDEYLLDGGDRDLPVHYGANSVRGLNTEDTVAEFTDDTGEQHVLPTNRVAVYSPKFGSMRTLSTPHADTGIRQLAATSEAVTSAGIENQMNPLDHTQRDSLEGMVTRSRASGLDADAVPTAFGQSDQAQENVKIVNAIENLKFVQSGRFLETEAPALSYGIQAAATWTRDENPVILATDESAQGVMATFRPQEIVGLEEEYLTKGRLRIVKLADRKTAQAGDVITFTIRYDNLGDRELHEIRLLDNLTPRLAYIDQSATSDRAGRLVVEQDETGSTVLVFEVDEPLPGHTGGVVTFQTRVR